MEREKIEKIAEKLGLPYPECENEEDILIQIACEKLGVSLPTCENEEEMLYRWIMEMEDD